MLHQVPEAWPHDAAMSFLTQSLFQMWHRVTHMRTAIPSKQCVLTATATTWPLAKVAQRCWSVRLRGSAFFGAGPTHPSVWLCIGHLMTLSQASRCPLCWSKLVDGCWFNDQFDVSTSLTTGNSTPPRHAGVALGCGGQNGGGGVIVALPQGL